MLAIYLCCLRQLSIFPLGVVVAACAVSVCRSSLPFSSQCNGIPALFLLLFLFLFLLPPPSLTVLTYSNRGREYVGNRTLCITCLMSHGTGEYPLPAYGTKLCGCQGDGECAALGQHCCCYSAAKDDISCTQDPVTQPNQCCGDPSNDCKKSAKLDAAGAQRPQPPWSL